MKNGVIFFTPCKDMMIMYDYFCPWLVIIILKERDYYFTTSFHCLNMWKVLMQNLMVFVQIIWFGHMPIVYTWYSLYSHAAHRLDGGLTCMLNHDLWCLKLKEDHHVLMRRISSLTSGELNNHGLMRWTFLNSSILTFTLLIPSSALHKP